MLNGIRLAGADDAPRISQVLFDAFVEYESLYTQEGFAATAINDEKVLTRMAEGPMWVVLKDGVLVGTAAGLAEDQSLYVRGMAVDPSARGQRIGHTLLATIEEFARAALFRRMYLSTTPFLDRAIRLYEGFGFKRINKAPGDLCGTPLFSMEKIL